MISPTDSSTQVTRSTLLLIPRLLNLADFYCLLVVQFSAFQEATAEGTRLSKGLDGIFVVVVHKILQHSPSLSYWLIRTKKFPVLQLLWMQLHWHGWADAVPRGPSKGVTWDAARDWNGHRTPAFLQFLCAYWYCCMERTIKGELHSWKGIACCTGFWLIFHKEWSCGPRFWLNSKYGLRCAFQKSWR